MRSVAILSLAVAAVVACAEPAPPADGTPLAVRVTGSDHQWVVTYPGADGRLGTADDRRSRGELRVPERRALRFELASRDFVYRFALPELDVNQIAVPDLTFDAEVAPLARGRYRLLGDELCGYAHESLIGELIVDRGDDFEDWMRALPTGGTAGEIEDEDSAS
ncbi:MAG TPA: hypothetical protein VM617_02810 [Thermoanaerobaculia bacterium]|nr:hypothetical protein [Thermoanaerobaculia bacterium]